MTLLNHNHITPPIKDTKGVVAGVASTKSVGSKVKIVFAPSALVPRNKYNQKKVHQKCPPAPISSKGRVSMAITEPAVSIVNIKDNPARESASKVKEVGNHRAAPAVAPPFTPKPITKVTTFSKTKRALAKPYRRRSSLQGDPFATHGDSFYVDRRASISSKSKHHFKGAKPAQLVTRFLSAAVALPIATHIVNNAPYHQTANERPVVATHETIASLHNGDYSMLRTVSSISSDFDIMEVRRSTGHPVEILAEARVVVNYAAKHSFAIATSAAENTTSTNLTSSENNQPMTNFEDGLCPTSAEVTIVPNVRESIFCKAKKGIKKSIKDIFRPCGDKHEVLQVLDQVVVPYPDLHLDSAPATVVPISQTKGEIKPKPALSPAKKLLGVRLSFPPVSGSKIPATRRSGHGIRSLRRTGQSTDTICICYSKIKKIRVRVPTYYPVALSSLEEDVLVSIFPPRGEFKLDEAARYLTRVYVIAEADPLVECISHSPESSFVSLSVSKECMTLTSSLVSQCASLSSESVYLCYLSHSNVDPSLEPVVNVVEECVESVPVSSSYSGGSIANQYLGPVASSPSSPYPLSVLDEYLDPVAALTPSQSCLTSTVDIPDLSLEDSLSVSNALDENVEQSPIHSSDATGCELELSECITPVSDSNYPPFISTPPEVINATEIQKISKAMKRCAKIFPSSAGLGFNVDTEIIPLDEHNLRIFDSIDGPSALLSPVHSSNASIGSPSSSASSAFSPHEVLVAHRAAIYRGILPISDQGIQSHRNAVYDGLHHARCIPQISPIACSPRTCASPRSLANANRAIFAQETRQHPTACSTLRGFTHPTSLASSPRFCPPPAPQRPQRSYLRTPPVCTPTSTHEEVRRLLKLTNTETTLSYLPGYQRPPF